MMIFIGIASPARPIKLMGGEREREREREREGDNDIYKHCGSCKTCKTT